MTTGGQVSTQIHNRAVRREILLPFAGGVLLLIALIIVAIVAGQTPTSGIANTMLTVLILCPLVLCLFPIYIVLIVALVAINKAHNGVAKPLRRLEALSLQMRERTYSASDRLARTSINLNTRFAPLDKLVFSLFDRPTPKEDDHE
jgi:TM2 domain-containing membrane protein YozV